MKKLLENRSAAVAATAVLCLLFAVLGLNRSVAREAERYTRGFYEGVETEGYTSASLYGILKRIDTYALTLSSVYADVPALETERESLVSARRSLVDAMEARDIAAMYGANRQLCTAAEALTAAAGRTALSAGDREKGEDAYAGFSSAQGALGQNPYNEYASRFQSRVMGTLPARLFRPLIFVKGPQLFANKEF